MTKTVVNAALYLAGDWLSQTYFQGRGPLSFDGARATKNAVLGAAFGPVTHWYYEWSDSALPVVSLSSGACRILLDQSLYLYLKCSAYICAVSLLDGSSVPTALGHANERIGPVARRSWRFWPAVHGVTYSIIPSRHRVLWVGAVDVLWNAVLANEARGEGGNVDK